MVRCTVICCSRAAPTLLVHVSLLLLIIAGAGVATLARLKWDPSTYLIFRGLLPNVYRVLSGVLCFSSFMLIALAHLAVCAQSLGNPKYQRWRQALFLTYAALMMALIIVELGTVAWLAVKVYEWIDTGAPRYLINASLEIINVGSKVLNTGNKVIRVGSGVYQRIAGLLSRRRKREVNMLSLIAMVLGKVKGSMAEILYDLPFNLGVGVAFIGAAAILQPLAVLLAINAAFPQIQLEDTLGEGVTKTTVNYVRYNSDTSKTPIQIHTTYEKKSKFEAK